MMISTNISKQELNKLQKEEESPGRTLSCSILIFRGILLVANTQGSHNGALQ